MKTTTLSLVAVAVLGAATLRAQTPSDQPSVYIPPAPAAPAPSEPAPPPPPPPYPYGGYGYYGGYESPTHLTGAITVPYAFNWNAVGVSAELGGLWNGNQFLGGEVSYYDGDAQRYYVYNGAGQYQGTFRSSQQITTVDVAYRYYAHLGDLAPHSPVSFYIGASAGVGFVSYSDTGAGYGFRNFSNDDGDFTGEVLAGFKFNAGRDISLRLGWRYVTVDDVWAFDRRVDLDSSVLEAGVGFRF